MNQLGGSLKRVKVNLFRRKLNDKGLTRTWVSSLRYIVTKEGWLYIVIFVDLQTRKVTGWSLAPEVSPDLVVAAFRGVGSGLNSRVPQVVLTQYHDAYKTAFRSKLRKYGCKHKMFRGIQSVNAVANVFFHALGNEFLNHQKYETFENARLSILTYFELVYNKNRHKNIMRTRRDLLWWQRYIKY